MNKILRSFLPAIGAIAVALPFASCDDIDEIDRVIKGETNAYAKLYQTSIVVVENEVFYLNDEHRMLVADFTGWKCVNCPTVAEYLTSNITPVYPSVLVSLHMTTNSFSANHPDMYNCPSADSIANWINGSPVASMLPLPSVSIDNVEQNGQVLIGKTDDLGNIASARNKVCNVDKSTTHASLSINVTSLGDDTYDLSTLIMCPSLSDCTLRLWLIEEGLVSRLQQSSQGLIRNYENHGILRQVINGSYEGQNVSLKTDGKAVVHTTLNLAGKGYNAQNCRIVAFITSNGSREVINCTDAPLVTDEYFVDE